MTTSAMPATGAGARRAARWLALAVTAVSVSGLFAILIALARVPALGMLFPGPEFYRVALALHVNLSQGVWFMAFAGALWSLRFSRLPEWLEQAAWWAAALGTLGVVLSVAGGQARPLMSNYLPVIDSSVFLGGILLFGLGVALKALGSAGSFLRQRGPGIGGVADLALGISALQTVVVFGLLIAAAWAIGDHLDGHAYFETLFWGPGHVWQFALISLLMYCWLEMAPVGAKAFSPRTIAVLVAGGALPVVAALVVPLADTPGSARYTYAYTWLMQWTSWEAPLVLGCLLGWRSRKTAPGFGLSLLLFVAGLLLGTQINGQTTLVTAHYHGTIGAVTLAFMAASFLLLPRFGVVPPSLRSIRLQLGFYGYGILLMMAGLAGAGIMGAPRKTPGDLGMSWSVETVSRICLGLGGTLATIGIVMFAVLMIRRLFPLRSALGDRAEQRGIFEG